MAKFRPIYKTIWKDPDFQELSPEQKLLFFYFCTNESINESGIYQLTPKTVANDTSISYETVVQLLSNCAIKNIVYDMDNKVIYVRKMRKYSTGGKPELIRKAIENEYKLLHKSKLWDLFFEDYPLFKPLSNGYQSDVAGFYTTATTNNNNFKEGDTKGENGNSAEIGEVFRKYESNIGLLSPKVADLLNDMIDEYTPLWVMDAIDQSVIYNKRNIAYMEAICKRWKDQGKGNGHKPEKKNALWEN